MEWLTILLAAICIPVGGLLLSFIFYGVYWFTKGKRFKPGHSNYKPPSFFRRIFVDFPKQFWLDKYNADPTEFREYGLHLFCGEQGSGKTTAVVHLLQMLQAKYPKLRVRTNFHYDCEVEALENWQQLVKNENGVYGQVEVIDEIQTWFNSMQSKDFPPEMLTEISQQRKQRKMLIGTAQVFGRVAKPIREQTTFVYCPMTIFGCLTIVRVSKPHFYDEAEFKFKRYIRTYFFVHNHRIREAFDTYKKIEGMVKAGFNVRPELYNGKSV